MKIKKIFTILLAIIFCLCVLGVFFVKNLNNPPNIINADKVNFKIEMGSSAKKIIYNLKKEGLIKSTNYAFVYLKLQKLNLKAGSYDIDTNMTTKQILHSLTKGTQALKKITIPEGLSLKKMAKLFEEQKLAEYEEFLELVHNKEFLKQNGIKSDSAEGFLFPETYFFGAQDSLEMMLKMVISTFFEKTSSIDNFPKDFSELQKKLILASIIEREYQIPEEAPMIASVFSNRLKINMGLQSCATVEYIITEIQGKKHPKRLFYVDLEIKNDYNTYMYAGLPPGPICSPGFTALKAACNPANTDYFYFRLVDPDTGKHSFSKTMSEHTKVGKPILLKNKK